MATLPNEKEERDRDVHLEWRDYAAIVIAALQTTLLPFLVVIVVLLALWYILAR